MRMGWHISLGMLIGVMFGAVFAIGCMWVGCMWLVALNRCDTRDGIMLVCVFGGYGRDAVPVGGCDRPVLG